MTDIHVRVLRADEHRQALDLVYRALHHSRSTDEEWTLRAKGHQEGRILGAFLADELIGTAAALTSDTTVPGGARLPTAAVTGVGVRADRRRRGALRALMHDQLRDAAQRGEAMAALHASETSIYGRFGYGIGTHARGVRVHARHAAVRPDIPSSGEIRQLGGVTEVLATMPEVYRRIGRPRVGMMERPEGWWAIKYGRWFGAGDSHEVAVHEGTDGASGFVCYRTQEISDYAGPNFAAHLEVVDLHANSLSALADLWRHLLAVDLVATIETHPRPLDEPYPLLFTDPRVCTAVPESDDEIWYRLLDVPRALASRSYQDAEPVVIEVRDELFPDNAGRYRLSAAGADRTDAAADLHCDVQTLAMLYFGSYRASDLAELGRITIAEQGAAVRADQLLRTEQASWCGTGY
ncbi:putative acetyltransferase [Tamaricihabitans halophyticus]|uniref:Putative acetyltransferase n=1 Tax=Tamaricihabitans halophyticus TaxID=1262583 RepID=A0A4R2QMV0_9PSEU|nr:GNAT family N-acetyltransferase [Tamaricihabitans halophyticus]TCP50902.1 putative acetyltransferase [Tamaricihabitans halophyticus]